MSVVVSAKPVEPGSVTPYRVEERLKLVMAIQCGLGGLILGYGNGAEQIWVIAIFFAAFGYVFVDRMKLFALPTMAAYGAMLLVALYCFGQYRPTEDVGQPQMLAVAQLLVYVQSILMLQAKNTRIYEQLIVFSLLEVVVAGVFNNAIFYAVVFVPMLLLSVYALCMMSTLQMWSGIRETHTPTSKPVISWSPSTMTSFANVALRSPRIAIATLSPAVFVVGMLFFYGLPRVGPSARGSASGPAVVGFKSSLSLRQLGQVLQNPTPALRVSLRRQDSANPYLIDEPLYLRGATLEIYSGSLSSANQDATWTAIPLNSSFQGLQTIPSQYDPHEQGSLDLYDKVDVEFTCEPMEEASLFSIAPYHRKATPMGLAHFVHRWTFFRQHEQSKPFARLVYSLGTHGFFRGTQTRLLTQYSHTIEELLPASGSTGVTADENDFTRFQSEVISSQEEYEELVRAFDRHEQPTALKLADIVVDSLLEEHQNPFYIAQALERHLSSSGSYKYSLNLNAKRVPGLDQTEQFLKKDRSGHCQYFASALAMMLRSQGIPSRLVVGYCTDEYNDLTKYFTARQLHAHVWVEALIPKQSLPELRPAGEFNIEGQLPSESYWLRLDPTPSGAREEAGRASRVTQVMDMARNIWDEYVVDMDGNRQDEKLLGSSTIKPVSDSYSSMIRWLQIQVDRVRNGELGAGTLSRTGFSETAALLGVALTLLVAGLLRFRFPGTLKRFLGNKHLGPDVPEPSISFFAEVLQQLARIGLRRRTGQTPLEFTQQASGRGLGKLKIGDAAIRYDHSIAKQLDIITQAFYQYRFGRLTLPHSHAELEPELRQALAEVRNSIDRMTQGNSK
jgi:hypothetical protein